MRQISLVLLATLVLAAGCAEDDGTGPSRLTTLDPALNSTAVEDVTPPTLTALSFTPTTINTTSGPANVTVSFTVTDDLSGATNVGAIFRSPSGDFSQGDGIGFPPATSHSGSFTINFPQFSEPGTWVLTADTRDNVDNDLSLDDQDLADLGFRTELIVGPLETEVSIDIKPGSDPNCVKATSKGVLSVAILEDGVDVTTVDVATIEIDDDGDPNTIGVAPVRSSVRKDVSDDGQPDLVLQFKTGDLNNAGLLSDGNTLFITGELTDGTPIQGSDVIFLAGGPNCFDQLP